MAGQLLVEAQAMQEELVSWRRTLHQIPEIGVKLPQTVAFVVSKLEEMGVAYEVYEDCSCVTATVGQGGKCILLRGDMDALPVEEKADVDFKSTNGCMHACGHDFHATSLLGAVKLLKARESELKGTVKFIFQSGEETFAGAKAAIECGVMEHPHVDAAFGTHVFAAMPLNTIFYGKEAMASVYGFRINIQGKGTHGSSPETGVDPLTVGAYILLGLQELIAREISGSDEVVLTIGHFAGGSAPNIVPDTALLEGTLRAFNSEVRAFVMQRIHEVAEGIAKTYRASITIEELSNVPAVISDDGMIELALESLKTLDEDVVAIPSMHAMGSEDFAFYNDRVPAVMFGIGAGVTDKSKWVGQHNPNILFDEACLPLETALYAQVAIDWLEKNN